MARRDELTNRGPLVGNKRSHALNHCRRKWNVNLQTVSIKVGNKQTKKVKVSTRTLKTLRKQNKLA